MLRNLGGRTGLGARAAVLAIALLALGLAGGPPVAASGQPAYLDAHRSTEDRVNDLLGRMTLAEKVGQMDQIVVGKLRGDCSNTNGPLVPACEQQVLIDSATGSILAGATDNPVDN